MYCRRCGDEIVGRRSGAIYCSSKCQERHVQENRGPRLDRHIRHDPRICENCGIEYIPQRLFSDGRNRFCSRTCKQKNRIKDKRAAAATQKHYYKTHYGLNMDEVVELRLRNCDICGTNDFPGRHKQSHIDHDHVTGQVRGVLCHKCNLGIGQFNENLELLAKAAEYLQRNLSITP